MKGQVTVFLSLMLLLILSVLCSVFEFTRQRVLVYYLDCAVDATKESCLAGYHRGLWEGYGIFSMYDDGRIEEFMEENLMAYGASGGNWYPFCVVSTGFFSRQGLCDNHGEAFREMAVAYMKAGIGDGEIIMSDEKDSLIAEGLQLVKRLEEKYGNLTVSFEENINTAEETEEEKGFLNSVIDRLKDLKNTAVSALVFPGMKFSERKIESIKDEKALKQGKSLAYLDGILFKAYIWEKFPTLLMDSKGYDLEYILGNSDSDKENLLEVVNELLLMREGMNLMYLYSSNFRQTELTTAAVLLAAFVGQPELITAVKYFLMLCWAFAEAVSDVKVLVNGGKVPLQKNDRNWHTDLESLIFGGAQPAVGGNKNGMSYEDYLKVLLMMQKEEKTALRALEIMQWRVRERYQGFLITRCVTEAEYVVEVETKCFFHTMFTRGQRQTLIREGVLAYE